MRLFAPRLTGRLLPPYLPVRYSTRLPCRCETYWFFLEASVTEQVPGLSDKGSGFPFPLLTGY